MSGSSKDGFKDRSIFETPDEHLKESTSPDPFFTNPELFLNLSEELTETERKGLCELIDDQQALKDLELAVTHYRHLSSYNGIKSSDTKRELEELGETLRNTYLKLKDLDPRVREIYQNLLMNTAQGQAALPYEQIMQQAYYHAWLLHMITNQRWKKSTGEVSTKPVLALWVILIFEKRGHDTRFKEESLLARVLRYLYKISGSSLSYEGINNYVKEARKMKKESPELVEDVEKFLSGEGRYKEYHSLIREIKDRRKTFVEKQAILKAISD